MLVSDLLGTMDTDLIKRCYFITNDQWDESSCLIYRIAEILTDPVYIGKRTAKVKHWCISPALYETYLAIYI